MPIAPRFPPQLQLRPRLWCAFQITGSSQMRVSVSQILIYLKVKENQIILCKTLHRRDHSDWKWLLQYFSFKCHLFSGFCLHLRQFVQQSVQLAGLEKLWKSHWLLVNSFGLFPVDDWFWSDVDRQLMLRVFTSQGVSTYKNISAP